MARSPKITVETREIATADTDPSYPLFDGLLRQTDEIVIAKGGGRGLKLYDELERDARVHAVVNKRKGAVIARDWRVDAAADQGREREAAELVEEAIRAMHFDRLCVDLLDAVLKGFAVVELMPVYRDGIWVVDQAIARDQRRFVFDAERRPRLLTIADPVRGVELPERKFIVHTHGGRDADPYGRGLGAKLFWPVYFKRQGIQFWLILTEKFGNPTTYAKYPAGAEDTEIDKMLAAMRALSSDGAIAIPEDYQLELLEAGAGRGVTTHEQLLRYMDEQIAEAVLGETLTTNVGQAGSRAASQTHDEVRLELAQADSDMLSGTLNRTFARWLTDWNFGPEVRAPSIWRDFSEEEDLNARAERDAKLAAIGWHLSEERFAEIYGEGYERKEPAAPPAPRASGSPGPDAPDPAAPDPAEAENGDEPAARATFAEPVSDALDDLTRQMDEAAAPALAAMIETLRAELEAASSLEDFDARLLAAFGEMPADPLAEAIRRGLVVADMTGRLEILEPDEE